jgi:hypothetical protein
MVPQTKDEVQYPESMGAMTRPVTVSEAEMVVIINSQKKNGPGRMGRGLHKP